MIEILYQDASLVVCIKPIGIPSELHGDNSMPALLQAQLECDIYPVHRLDQPVSGLMVYAKTAQAAGKLSGVLQEDSFVKEYLAICEGNMEIHEAIWNDLLYHDKNRNKSFIVNRKRNGVKDAKLQYWVLDSNEQATLCKVKLYTGRTHQIRTQFAYHGHPLCGDGKYGSHDNRCTCALYSYHMKFQHPFKKKALEFYSIPTHIPFDQYDLSKLNVKEEQ